MIGIVLSDGAAGLRAIKARAGLTLVQCPQSAEVPFMPRAAIAAGHPDAILPVLEMAQLVGRLYSHVHSSNSLSGSSSRFRAPGGKCVASTAPQSSIAVTKPSPSRPALIETTRAPDSLEALLAAFGSCFAVGIQAHAIARSVPIRFLKLELEADIDATAGWGAGDLKPG